MLCSAAELYELGSQYPYAADPNTNPTRISSSGALVAYSGKKTGFKMLIY